MKKIVFAIMIGLTTSVYGQLEYISRDGYEKIGEYRYNDRTGHIEYYEPQKLGRRSVDNWSNLLAAAYSANMYSAIQKAKLRDEYIAIAGKYSRSGDRAFDRNDYKTARKEYWNAYIYLLTAQQIMLNKNDIKPSLGMTYGSYLLSLIQLKDYDKFIDMYDYNIIKYAGYYRELQPVIDKLKGWYYGLIEERNKQRLERERRELEYQRKIQQQQLEKERIEREYQQKLEEERQKKQYEEYKKIEKQKGIEEKNIIQKGMVNLRKNYKNIIKVFPYTHLYEKPDMNDKEIYLIPNEEVALLEKTSDKYYKVKTANGKVGYIFTGFIKK